MLRVAINGFGRIGRVFLRLAQNHPSIQVVAINDLADASILAHLFQYDSVHGRFSGAIRAEEDSIWVNDQRIQILQKKDPSDLPWKALDIDVVIESSGKHKNVESCQKHLNSGAKRVILSAPPSDEHIPMSLIGVNEDKISLSENIISNASCTTNSCAHIIQEMDKLAGIVKMMLTTVHSFTNDQTLHDQSHKDLRRARAATKSMIPTTTGAIRALKMLFPDLRQKLHGGAIRVPVENGSISEMTFLTLKTVSVEEINAHFASLAEGRLSGIISYTSDPIVSVDIIGNGHSAIFDSGLTMGLGNMLRISTWYDNEAGYSSRLVDHLERYDRLLN